MPDSIVARGLVKRFGSRVALDGVGLTAAAGEVVAVIGPNGAGKTTLLSILAGVLRADEGSVDRAAREVGWVPQQPAVYSKLSVEQNLRLFARLEQAGDGAVEAMLEQTGLHDRRGDPVGSLSGGNRQRVNIAVGLLGDPPVVALDEPSASLDPRQRERLWDFVTALAGHGKAIVFTTHNVQEAERYADRIVVLADGTVLFDGPPLELEQVVEGGGRARSRPSAGPLDRSPQADFEAAFVQFLAEHDPPGS